MIKLIVAYGLNGEIGKGDTLLWHLPKDLTLFKEKTLASIVVMGHSTFKGLPTYPKGLPHRYNEVVTNKITGSMYTTLTQWIEQPYGEEDEVWIIGGASIYKQLEHLAEEIHVTEVQANCPEADTFYKPNLEGFTEDVSQRVDVSSEDLKAVAKVYIKNSQ